MTLIAGVEPDRWSAAFNLLGLVGGCDAWLLCGIEGSCHGTGHRGHDVDRLRPSPWRYEGGVRVPGTHRAATPTKVHGTAARRGGGSISSWHCPASFSYTHIHTPRCPAGLVLHTHLHIPRCPGPSRGGCPRHHLLDGALVVPGLPVAGLHIGGHAAHRGSHKLAQEKCQVSH
jgi:hypothetical protein